MTDFIDFKLNFNGNKDIKILQITDTQKIDSGRQRYVGRLNDAEVIKFDGNNAERKLYSHIRELINMTNPDLILITGDIVYGEFDDDGANLIEFCEFLNAFNIPWAPVFGNHDNESKMGVTWQCNTFLKYSNCLFKRGEVTGNGNYTIGIYRENELIKIIYMLDSNGCGHGKKYSYLENYPPYNEKEKITEVPGIFADQKKWIEESSKQFINVKKMACMHIAPDIISSQCFKNGYQSSSDLSNKETFVIGKDVESKNNDFGFKGEHFATFPTNDLWDVLTKCGFSDVIVGHEHLNTLSVLIDGIRLTYGVKTGTYDYGAFSGGNLFTLDTNNKFSIKNIFLDKEYK